MPLIQPESSKFWSLRQALSSGPVGTSTRLDAFSDASTVVSTVRRDELGRTRVRAVERVVEHAVGVGIDQGHRAAGLDAAALREDPRRGDELAVDPRAAGLEPLLEMVDFALEAAESRARARPFRVVADLGLADLVGHRVDRGIETRRAERTLPQHVPAVDVLSARNSCPQTADSTRRTCGSRFRPRSRASSGRCRPGHRWSPARGRSPTADPFRACRRGSCAGACSGEARPRSSPACSAGCGR